MKTFLDSRLRMSESRNVPPPLLPFSIFDYFESVD